VLFIPVLNVVLKGRDKMGMVALTMRVMLDGPKVDIEGVKSKIRAKMDVKEMKEVPVAFGLKSLEILLTFDDKKGADIERIESDIRGIKGVASVESGDITLI